MTPLEEADIAAAARRVRDTVDSTERAVASVLGPFVRGLAPVDAGILPRGTRYSRTVGSYHLTVVEEAPRRRTTFIEGRATTVSLPWVVYVVMSSTLRVFFRNSPLVSLDDVVYMTPLPHFYSGRVCMNIGFITTVADVLRLYWSTNFTPHAGGDPSNQPDFDVHFDLHRFARMSEEQVLAQAWTPHKLPTLRQHVDQLLPVRFDAERTIKSLANAATTAALLETQR